MSDGMDGKPPLNGLLFAATVAKQTVSGNRSGWPQTAGDKSETMNRQDDLGFSPAVNRIMGGWRDIVEDTRRLNAIAQALPDGCECRPGATCDCCVQLERPFSGQCRTCAVKIQQLSERLKQVLDDTLRYLPPIKERAELLDIQQHLQHVVSTLLRLLRVLRQLESATGEFAHGCAAAHVQPVKAAAAELAAAVETAHRALRAAL